MIVSQIFFQFKIGTLPTTNWNSPKGKSVLSQLMTNRHSPNEKSVLSQRQIGTLPTTNRHSPNDKSARMWRAFALLYLESIFHTFNFSQIQQHKTVLTNYRYRAICRHLVGCTYLHAQMESTNIVIPYRLQSLILYYSRLNFFNYRDNTKAEFAHRNGPVQNYWIIEQTKTISKPRFPAVHMIVIIQWIKKL